MLVDTETFVEGADIFKKRLINAIIMTKVTKAINDYIKGFIKPNVFEKPDTKITYGPVKIRKKGKVKKW